MEKETLKGHPIQLEFVGVKELQAKTFTPPSPDNEFKIETKHIKMNVGHGEYDKEKKMLPVQITLEIGNNNQKTSKLPLYIKVAIIGIFKTVEKNPNIDAVHRFVKNNATHLLHPFLREHVFALSARCGVRPIILPLVTVSSALQKK